MLTNVEKIKIISNIMLRSYRNKIIKSKKQFCRRKVKYDTYKEIKDFENQMNI